ncbi:hypothetical protein ABIE69_002686 [Rhodobacteraceae bacterium MBR-64]
MGGNMGGNTGFFCLFQGYGQTLTQIAPPSNRNLGKRGRGG